LLPTNWDIYRNHRGYWIWIKHREEERARTSWMDTTSALRTQLIIAYTRTWQSGLT